MDSTGQQILVVEDNLALASVVRFNLERAGYKVSLASDGLDGWQQAQTTQFDLVITDQQMPIMSGCELCEKLRQTDAYEGVPIIMLTAKGLELDLVRLQKEYGVTASFSKPFSPQQVIEAVGSHLNGDG
jgi:CheY-like chemotaxis protein